MKSISQKTVRWLLAIVSLLLACVLIVQCLFWAGIFAPKTRQAQSASAVEAVGTLSHEGYQLEQVVILSRHNIRSPLSGSGSALGTITPHEWFAWSSNPSELSLRGGVLETEMGQYFRKWLEAEGLFPENYRPEDGKVRIGRTGLSIGAEETVNLVFTIRDGECTIAEKKGVKRRGSRGEAVKGEAQVKCFRPIKYRVRYESQITSAWASFTIDLSKPFVKRVLLNY